MAGMAPPYPKPKPQPQMIRVVDLETTGSAPPAHGVCEIGWQDVALGEDGRILLRSSGTEPIVRVMVEAATQADAEAIAQRLAAVVRTRLAL